MKIMNTDTTSVETIAGQLLESRPLPMGREEFHEWADRIIAGAVIPCDPNANYQHFIDSQKFCLANLIMHLGPTESHKPDAFFIHSLRKFAVNEVANAMRNELKMAQTARSSEEDAKKAHLSVLSDSSQGPTIV